MAAPSTRPSASEAEAVLLEFAQGRGRAGLQIFGQFSNDVVVLHGLEEDLALTRIACRGQVGEMKASAILCAGRLKDLFHSCNTEK